MSEVQAHKFDSTKSHLDAEQIKSDSIPADAELRAIGFEYLMGKALYPTQSPVSKRLSELLRYLTEDPEVRIFVYRSSGNSKGAEALPNKCIIVSDALISCITSTEMALALLQHELSHIERKDHETSRQINPSTLRSFYALRRKEEFIADQSELLALSDKGINPYGAIELQSLLQELAKSRKSSGYDLPVAIDIEHGTPEQRLAALRETIRFLDLPHLSISTHKENFAALVDESNVFKAEGEIDPQCDDLTFWTGIRSFMPENESDKLKQRLIASRIQIFFHDIDPKIRSEVTDLVWDLYQATVCHSSKPAKLLSSSNFKSFEAWGYLLAEERLQKIGFLLTSQFLILAAAPALEALIMDEKYSEARFLRSQIVDYLDKRSISTEASTVDLDTEIAILVIKQLSKNNTLTPNVNKNKKLFFKKTGGKLSLESCDGNKVIDILNEIGADIVDISRVFHTIAREWGIEKTLDIVNELESNSNNKNTEIEVFVSDDAKALFYGSVASLVNGLVPLSVYQGKRLLELPHISQAKVRALSHFISSQRITTLSPFIPDWNSYQNTDHIEYSAPNFNFTIERVKFLSTLNLWKPMFQVLKNLSKETESPEQIIKCAEEIVGDYAKDLTTTIRLQEFSSMLMHLHFGKDTGIDSQHPVEGLSIYKHNSSHPSPVERIDAIKRYVVIKALGTKSALSLAQTLEHTALAEIELSQESIEEDGNNPLENAKKTIEIFTKILEITSRVFIGSEGENSVTDPNFKSKITSIGGLNKFFVLNILASLDAEGILRTAPEIFFRWPSVWVPLDTDSFKDRWEPIREKLVTYLSNQKGKELTNQEREGLLSVLLLSQGSLATPQVCAALLREMVNHADSLESGLNILEKYDFIPVSVLLPSIQILVEKRARYPHQVRLVSDIIRKWAEHAEYGDFLIQYHLATALAQFSVTQEEKLPLFTGLLTTNDTDAHLIGLLAPIYWRSLPRKQWQNAIRNSLTLVKLAERRPGIPTTLEDIEDSLRTVTEKSPFLDMGARYVPFNDAYQQLFDGGSIFNYLLLRHLAIDNKPKGGDRLALDYIQLYGIGHSRILFSSNPGLFESSVNRVEIFKTIVGHYVTGEGQEIFDSPVVSSIVQGLAHGPSSEDLFYFVGPLLAKLAGQPPRDPSSFNQLPESVREIVEKFLLEDDGNINDPFPGQIAQGFRHTKAIAYGKALSILSGTRPIVDYDDAKNKLSFRVETDPNVMSLELYLTQQCFPNDGGLPFSNNNHMTIIDLAIMVAEHSHTIGRRMLQLFAMTRGHLMADAERRKIELSFDRVPGMNWSQVIEIMDREAQNNVRHASLMAEIETIEPIENGGSIFTVPFATMRDGREVAIHVRNSNALFMTEEVARFYEEVINGIPEGALPPSDLKLASILLQTARKWTICEILDPEYVVNFIEFRSANDYRERIPESGTPFFSPLNSSVRIIVPQIIDTGSLNIRWQERDRGVTLARLELGDVTDLSQGTVTVEDATEIAVSIVQNHFFQLLESGLFHSNIHLGNFGVKRIEDGGFEVAIFDTKNLQRLSDDERESLLGALVCFIKGDIQGGTTLLVRLMVPMENNPDVLANEIIKELKKESPASIEDALGIVMSYLYDKGHEVPLKWLLLFQNLIGCRYLLERAGWKEPIWNALLWHPSDRQDGVPTLERAKTLYPKSYERISKEVGFFN